MDKILLELDIVTQEPNVIAINATQRACALQTHRQTVKKSPFESIFKGIFKFQRFRRELPKTGKYPSGRSFTHQNSPKTADNPTNS